MHPLIYGNWIEKNYFAFRMYDGDNDGIISSIDIGDILKNLIDQCPM
jgi:Ca2+-binding EF-hand superfamily protein